jgi:hypothetical protein
MNKLVILFINVVVVELFLEVPFFFLLFYLYENLDKDVVFDFIIYLSEMFVCIYCIVCFFLKKQDSGSRISFSVFLLLFAFDVNPRVPEGIESDK